MVPIILLFLLLTADLVHATVRYVDGTAGACTGNYSISSRDCTGSDGDSFATIAAGISPTVAGDTLYLRSATYTTPIAMGSKAGTALAPITIAAYSGETVTIMPSGATHSITATSSSAYVIFDGLVFDGTNQSEEYGLDFSSSQPHHYTIQNSEIKNQRNSGVQIAAAGWTIRNNRIHDMLTDCAPGRRYYGIYLGEGDGALIEYNEIYNAPGGGIQAYPGDPVPITNLVIRYNSIHDNTSCTNSDVGGILLGNFNTGAKLYGNLIYSNGSLVGGATPAVGIRIFGGADDAQIVNNTIYGNTGRGVYISSAGSTGTLIQNNLIVGNAGTAISDGGTGTTQTTNRTTGTITDCTISTSDLRLKLGTNPCRDAGTAHATRPSPVGSVDIGAYEQGAVVSALALADGGIEATVSVMTPGVQPTSAITGFSVSCVGCTGTPAVGTVTVKGGSDNVVIVPLSGLSSSGTCTITLGATNATDNLYIGGTAGSAQGLNTVSGLSVSGNCANTGGGSPPGGYIAHYNFNASDAADQSGNGNHGTVSSGITFTSGFQGLAASIPSDTTYRHIAYPVGSASNLDTQPWTWCGVTTPDVQYAQKVVFSAGGNGADQRFYVGWATVGGQLQWGIGVQGSGFSTGSEFAVTAQPTLVCIRNNASTNTVHLRINRQTGVNSGSSIKTHTGFTTIASNFRVGNDGTFTTNNGGFVIDEPKLWNSSLSDADLDALYDSLFTSGSTAPCYGQSHVQFEGVYLSGGSPWVFTTNQAIDVVANGGVAIKMQVTCTGSAGSEISVVPYYSTDGATYAVRVPGTLGLDNIAMWGGGTSAGLNNGTSTGCIDATGLTASDGSTITDAVVSPAFTLAQNYCRTYRFIFRVGNIPGQSRYVRLYQDNGIALANGYSTTAQIRVVNPAATGIGF